MTDRIPWLALTALALAVTFDTATTIYALSQGAHEANPLVSPYASNPTAFITVKAAVFFLFAIPTIIVRTAIWERWILFVAGFLFAASIWNIVGVVL